MRSLDDLTESLTQGLGDLIVSCRMAFNELTLDVAASDLLTVCTVLRDDPRFAYSQLTDIAGMDYLAYGQADWQTDSASSTGFSRAVAAHSEDTAAASPFGANRFAAVYQLLSINHNSRLRIRAFAVDLEGGMPCLPSVVPIWSGANWFEREAFDLFGILFAGHPDLRRILTDYGFIGHPFRKDFPLEGYVEVRYDPEKRRVIYQPVTITPRVLVPRVIRKDTPFVRGQAGDPA
jgi:NADH-quinone oxidoreductase subunit C